MNRTLKTVLVLIACAVVIILQRKGLIPGQGPGEGPRDAGTARTEQRSAPPEAGTDQPRAGSAVGGEIRGAPGESIILELHRKKRSDVFVEGEGHIDRILPDDNEPPRHQKFVVRLSGGHTLLFAHNTDLAPRVPVEEGDLIRFRGEYEYEERGGVIHWTHHDPRGRHEEGWIEFEGRRYE